MKKTTITLGLVAAVCSAQSSFAQSPTTQPAPITPPAVSSPSTSADSKSSGGIQKASTATLAVRFMTIRSVDLMATKLIGTNVYNNQNESLGEVEDLVLDNGKTLSGVVISVGGFLGIGEHYVIVDPATMVVQVTDGAMKAYIDTSKDNLKSAPKFTYKKEAAADTRLQASGGMISYSADLKSSSEVPSNDSKGTGTLEAKFDPASKKLAWTITYSGLTGPATAAHFHGPAESGKNAPPVLTIGGSLASPLKGTATLTEAQVKDLQAGHWYQCPHRRPQGRRTARAAEQVAAREGRGASGKLGLLRPVSPRDC